MARWQLANIKLSNKDIEGGLPLAEEAVKIAPRLPLGHYVFGRLLLEAGQNDRAVVEVEMVLPMVDQNACIYLSDLLVHMEGKQTEGSQRPPCNVYLLNTGVWG